MPLSPTPVSRTFSAPSAVSRLRPASVADASSGQSLFQQGAFRRVTRQAQGEFVSLTGLGGAADGTQQFGPCRVIEVVAAQIARECLDLAERGLGPEYLV